MSRVAAATAAVAAALFAVSAGSPPASESAPPSLRPNVSSPSPQPGHPAPRSAAIVHAATTPAASANAAQVAATALGPSGSPLRIALAASVRPSVTPHAAPAPTAAPSSKGAVALAAALSMKGTPYVWGGSSPSGFDCSGLMLWAFKKAGVSLPRTSQAQSKVGQPVGRNELRPGDLVFFYSGVSHVGIYAGNGMVLHAPQSGDVVKMSPLSAMPFHNARRIS